MQELPFQAVTTKRSHIFPLIVLSLPLCSEECTLPPQNKTMHGACIFQPIHRTCFLHCVAPCVVPCVVRCILLCAVPYVVCRIVLSVLPCAVPFVVLFVTPCAVPCVVPCAVRYIALCVIPAYGLDNVLAYVARIAFRRALSPP